MVIRGGLFEDIRLAKVDRRQKGKSEQRILDFKNL